MKSKKEVIKSLAVHKKDVGSTAVQIGLLSEKINKLSQNMGAEIHNIDLSKPIDWKFQEN